MAGFNKIILVGRLAKNPEIKVMNSGDKVATFSFAVDRDYTKQDGTRPADFIRITAYGKKAEFVEKYLRKGLLILIEGRLQIDSWQDENGKWHNNTYVKANNFMFLEKKKDELEDYEKKYLKDINEIDRPAEGDEKDFEEINEILDDDNFPRFFPVDN